MTGNRLIERSAAEQQPGFTVADLHQWCADENDRTTLAGHLAWPDRWYYVSPNKDTGKHEIRTIDGQKAIEVRKAGQGWEADFHGWGREELLSETRLLRWFFKQGQPLRELVPA